MLHIVAMKASALASVVVEAAEPPTKSPASCANPNRPVVEFAAFDPARFTAGSGGAAAGAGRQRIAEEEAGDDDE